MQAIFNQVSQAMKAETHPIRTEQVTLNTSLKKKLLDEFRDSKFTLSAVTQYINSCTIVIRCTHPNFTINTLVPHAQHVPQHMLLRVAQRIAVMIRLFASPTPLKIWFLPVTKSRTFPQDKTQPICPEHVNGGYTYQSGSDIYVYRLEEFPKVMLHEFLHKTKVDTFPKWTDMKIWHLKRLFNISPKTTFIVNEAVVEAYAVMYHISFLAVQLGLSWKKLFKTELEWSRHQSEQCIAKQQHLANKQWYEKSNTFCYIVLKYVILSNVATFSKIPQGNVERIYRFLVAHAEDVPDAEHQHVPGASLRMTVFGDL